MDGADFDEEGFNWIENYNLIGLDPRFDLKELKIPKKAGLPEDVEEEPVIDEETGQPKPVVKKPINPDDYDLGLEDVNVYIKRQEEQQKRRLGRRQRNAERKQRAKNGDEGVSDAEEENSEEQMDENGQPLRMQPKIRPFINTPKITPISEIPEPQKHQSGYIWQLQLQHPIALLSPTAAEKNGFSVVAL